MTIVLNSEIESALSEAANRLGLSPDVLANKLLRERLSTPRVPDETIERFSRLVKDYGVSLPLESITSEGLYD